MDKGELFKALEAVGIERGDLLFVHSDLRPFGIPKGARTPDEILGFYYETLCTHLGSEGTLAVPAYFYEYARYGEPFDVERSPVSKPLGVFSAYVASLPARVRSCNPLQSLAAIGAQAEALCGGNSLMGYGLASPWHRLRLLRGKFLFLGVTLQPMTFVHHIEQQYGVPHLYHKIYSTPVLRQGKPLAGHPISAVRFLEYGIEYDLRLFQEELERRGQLKQAVLGESSLFSVTAEEAFRTGIDLLSQNPYVFLKKAPAFIAGRIPTDGVASHARS